MRKEILFGSITAVLLVLIGSGSFYAVKPLQSNSQDKSSLQGGVISGTVVNQEGLAIARADVLAGSTRGSRGMPPHTITDARGNFTIAGLEPGMYFMEARKESEGYASNRDLFASDGLAEIPQIALLKDQVVSGVIVRFGPKSARLTGKVIDAKTRKPIELADITLRRADNPEYFTAIGLDDPKTNSRFRVLVPPLPFTIEVKSSGYEDWTYSNDGSGKHMDALQLASGARKDLTIALHPK